MTQTTVVSNEEVEGLVAEWAHLTHLQGPPRLCTLPGAWSLWCKPQSLMRLGREWVVRGTVVRGSVSKFGFGKLMRERDFCLITHVVSSKPLMAKGHPDLKVRDCSGIYT